MATCPRCGRQLSDTIHISPSEVGRTGGQVLEAVFALILGFIECGFVSLLASKSVQYLKTANAGAIARAKTGAGIARATGCLLYLAVIAASVLLFFLPDS